MIRAKGHWSGRVLSSDRNTKSPTLGALPVSFHFERVCNWFKYSFFHRFQNCPRNFCTNLYLFSLVSFFDSNISGNEFGLVPIRKCLGVRGSKSLGIELIGYFGRELKIASICFIRVWISSYVKTVVPMILFKSFLAAFTPDSQSPNISYKLRDRIAFFRENQL